MKYYLNSYYILLLALSNVAVSQTDSLTLNYKFERCLKNFNTQKCYDYLKNDIKQDNKAILNWSTFLLYHGNETAGNALQKLCLSKMDTITCDDYQEISVQQTKNGDYEKAISYLEKAIAIDAKGHESYYGWLLLYYYRDYDKALQHLNHFDALTPNFVDAPVGENIHFLKALCHYQKNNIKEAINELEINRDYEIKRFGKKNCNSYVYFYLARCFEKNGNDKLAEKNYLLSIKASEYHTEANYYLGLLYDKQHKKVLAQKHVAKAQSLLKMGYKQQDIYVELFDEVYASQIEETLLLLK